MFRDEACCGAHHLGSILLERGIVVPQGRRSLLEALAVLSSRSRVGTRVQRLLDDMLDQWRAPYQMALDAAPLGTGTADLHLGQGRTLRPDTLMQTAQREQKPLADGAGHTLARVEP